MIKKYIKTAFLLLVTFSVFAQNKSENILQKEFDKRQEAFQKLDYGIVGLYRDKQGIVYKSAIGWTASGVKMTTDKVFNIGSLTKTFTAVLILQEIEKGNIKLTDTIGKFFKDILVQNKNIDPSITIENLLRHTSGLGEVIVDSIINDCFINPFCDYNNPVQFNHIPKPVAKKNEQYEYCNTNYILLGSILELVNDMPYAELVKERILIPCNMNNTFTYFSKSIPNAAHPIFDGQDLFDNINFRFYAYYCFSAGGLSSTVNDLGNFFEYLYSGKFFKKAESLKLMTSFKNKNGIGLSLTEISTKEHTYQFYGHDGDNLSFKCRNYYNPETGEQLIFLANQYGEKEIFKITNEILKQLIK